MEKISIRTNRSLRHLRHQIADAGAKLIICEADYLQRIQALIGQLHYVDLQGLSDDYLTTYVQKVNAVTPAQVQAMTTKYIKPESMTIVVVGDKSKITEQLKDYEAK